MGPILQMKNLGFRWADGLSKDTHLQGSQPGAASRPAWEAGTMGPITSEVNLGQLTEA